MTEHKPTNDKRTNRNIRKKIGDSCAFVIKSLSIDLSI